MLVIKSIKFKYNRQIGTQANKCLRIGYLNTFSTTKKRPIQKDAQNIQWIENITLPIYFNRQMDIQIFLPHQYGYNPQQMSSILKSTIKIINYKSQVVQAKVFNNQNKYVGQIFLTTYQQPIYGHIVISSLLIHLFKPQSQKGYCQLSINKNSPITTPQQKLISNQLMWIDQFKIPIKSQNINLKLFINVYFNTTLSYKCQIQLQKITRKLIKYKRVKLYNLLDQVSGHIFIDLQYNLNKQKINQLPSIDKNQDKKKSFHSHSRSQKLININKYKENQKKEDHFNINQHYLMKVFQIGSGNPKNISLLESIRKKIGNSQNFAEQNKKKNRKSLHKIH